MNNAFRMSVSACERWFSTVRLLMLSSRAISSLFITVSPALYGGILPIYTIE